MSSPARSMRDRLISGGGWAFGSKLAAGLMTVGISAVVTRLLSPAETGILFFSFTLVLVTALVGRFGFDQATVRLVAEARALNNDQQAHQLAATGVLVVFLMLLIVAWLMSSHFVSDIIIGVFGYTLLGEIRWLLSVWLLVLGLQIYIAEIFRAFQDIRLASLLSAKNIFGGVLSGAITGAILVVLWLAGIKPSLKVIVTIIVGCGTFGIVVAILFLTRLLGRWSNIRWNYASAVSLFKTGGWLLLTNLAMLAMAHGDILILALFRPAEDVALYAIASRLVKLIGIFLMAINEVVTPFVAELNVLNKKKRLEEMLRLSASLAAIPALMAAVFIFLFSGHILNILFGDFYIRGSTLLLILSIGQAISVYSGSCGQVLIMTGHHRLMMVLSVVSSVLMLGVGALISGTYGPEGLAVVVSSVVIAHNVTAVMLVRWCCGIWTHASPKCMLSVITDYKKLLQIRA